MTKKPSTSGARRPAKRAGSASAEQLRQAERQERWEARRLPLTFGFILIVVLISRVEALRDTAGRALGFGFPLLAAFFGIRPFRESALWTPALVIAGATSLAFVSVLSGKVTGESPARTALLVLLALAPVAGAVLQGAGASRGVRSYCAAWLGMGAMFAYFYAGHRIGGHDAFDAILGSALVALFVGGGVGIVLGIIATGIGKRG